MKSRMLCFVVIIPFVLFYVGTFRHTWQDAEEVLLVIEGSRMLAVISQS